MRVRQQNKIQQTRTGAVMAEMAVVLPVFFIFCFAMIEFGHCYLTINLLNAAAKEGARKGVSEFATNADIEARAEEIIASALDLSKVTIRIKDGSTFDGDNGGATNPENINYANLPNLEVDEAEPQQLYIVRVEVKYDDVAIFTPRWVTDLSLSGQAVMRKE